MGLFVCLFVFSGSLKIDGVALMETMVFVAWVRFEDLAVFCRMVTVNNVFLFHFIVCDLLCVVAVL